MANRSRQSPAELTTSWPEVASSDYAAEAARILALNLRDAMGDRSAREVARVAGMSDATVRHILAGTIWPDLRTIAHLERALGVALYPAREELRES